MRGLRRPTGDFDARRYFRGTKDLGFYNVGTPAIRRLAADLVREHLDDWSVAYFTLGSSAKVRRGDLLKTTLTEKGWDQGYAFMLIEIAGDDLYFETLSDTGVTVDSGVIHRTGRTAPTPGRSSQPVVVEEKTAPARAAQPG